MQALSTLLFASPTIAGEGPAPTPSPGLGVAAPTAAAASSAFDAAQFRRDVGALNQFLALDFRIIHASGRIGDRQDFLSDFADPTEVFDPFVIQDRVVTPLGDDGAVVSGEAIVTGKAGGKAFRQHFRYADIFRRTSGRWQAIYTQITGLKD